MTKPHRAAPAKTAEVRRWPFPHTIWYSPKIDQVALVLGPDVGDAHHLAVDEIAVDLGHPVYCFGRDPEQFLTDYPVYVGRL